MFATKQETTDLFGMPIHIDTSERIVRHREKKLHDRLANSINLVLFVELLDQLKAPLFKAKAAIPEEYRSDIAGVRLTEEAESEIAEVTDESHDDAIAIPYEAWGTPEVIDDKGLAWSHEGLIFLQVRLFWRSMEELALSNNEGEKWSVVRWIFRPAYWHYYSYDKRIGRSHRLSVHERDDPFSFHNCCMASRMDADAVREGVRRNISKDIIEAVEKVCSFE